MEGLPQVPDLDEMASPCCCEGRGGCTQPQEAWVLKTPSERGWGMGDFWRLGWTRETVSQRQGSSSGGPAPWAWGWGAVKKGQRGVAASRTAGWAIGEEGRVQG